jgi:hypothetical protein
MSEHKLCEVCGSEGMVEELCDGAIPVYYAIRCSVNRYHEWSSPEPTKAEAWEAWDRRV